MAAKHYEKKLKMRTMNSFRLRYSKLRRRKDKTKFKEELQQLARKYQQDIDDLEEEMLILKTENDKLNKEKDNMVFNLKNALQNGFDILNSSDTVENHSHSGNFKRMKTPEPVPPPGRSTYFKKGNPPIH